MGHLGLAQDRAGHGQLILGLLQLLAGQHVAGEEVLATRQLILGQAHVGPGAVQGGLQGGQVDARDMLARPHFVAFGYTDPLHQSAPGGGQAHVAQGLGLAGQDEDIAHGARDELADQNIDHVPGPGRRGFLTGRGRECGADKGEQQKKGQKIPIRRHEFSSEQCRIPPREKRVMCRATPAISSGVKGAPSRWAMMASRLVL